MGRSDIAIVIPAFNEAETIYEVACDVEKYGDVLIVDDYSTDGTRELVETTRATLLSHKSNLGYEASLSTGIKYAVENDYRYIITTDADGELIHFGIEGVVKFLKEGCLLVVGKRNKKNRMIEVLFGFLNFCVFRIQDPLCGMKGYNADIYRKYGFFDNRKMIGTELLAYSIRDDVAIQETPITVIKRQGESRFGGSFSSFIKISRVIFLFFGIAFKRKTA